MHEIRIRFQKLGSAKYISHLDLNRVFFRCVRLAKIPIWYTEGFNPHPHITYLLSLPLGVESKCEFIDIKIEDDEISDAEIKEKFNNVLPDGIKVLGINSPKMKMNDIYCAVYDIEYDTQNAEMGMKKIEDVMASGELIGSKKAKRGRIKVNVEFNLLSSVLTYSLNKTDSGFTMRILCLAGQNNNLNPVLFSQTLETAGEFEYESRNIVKMCMLNDECKSFE